MKKVIRNCATRLFQPIALIPKNSEIKQKIVPISQKLLIDNGLIRQNSPGVYHYLPLGLRVLNKLIKVVDEHMEAIEAQKLQLSAITEAQIWKKTGRWNSEQLESFKFKDRHGKDYLLSPTHEESITALISSLPPLSYKQLPLLLYQITSKYRDEIKPRCGLIRSREFMMKDLYSFDSDESNAETTYHRVMESYKSFFDHLGVPYLVALGASGEMGGSLSHEFHYPCDIGEDTVITCQSCFHSINIDISSSDVCNKCGSKDLLKEKTIEVGHTFLLGLKYSKALNACFVGPKGDKNLLYMGSYGLGLSRIIAASVESLSIQESGQIRWPHLIAPFRGIIIPPKEGSREASACGDLHLNIYEHLNELNQFHDDIFLDDRPGLTIGRKIYDSDRIGYPWAIIIGSMAAQTPSLLELRSVQKQNPLYLSIADLIHHLTHQDEPNDIISSNKIT